MKGLAERSYINAGQFLSTIEYTRNKVASRKLDLSKVDGLRDREERKEHHPDVPALWSADRRLASLRRPRSSINLRERNAQPTVHVFPDLVCPPTSVIHNLRRSVTTLHRRLCRGTYKLENSLMAAPAASLHRFPVDVSRDLSGIRFDLEIVYHLRNCMGLLGLLSLSAASRARNPFSFLIHFPHQCLHDSRRSDNTV